MNETTTPTQAAVQLLQELVATQSFSREEEKTADIITQRLEQEGKEVHRLKNNVWVRSQDFRDDWPTLLLNSHHDTVKPGDSWTRDPFDSSIETVDGEETLYGLGSNDAGGCLVALLQAFLHMDEVADRGFNLIFAASAEEEISGESGISALLPKLGKIDVGIVGEPTRMRMAVAEKGLLVLDCTATGITGHAARHEGVNAIYEALQDIRWIKNFRFTDKSDLLGETTAAVTQINAGIQHNIVPDKCTFVVDIRTNELYTNEQVLEIFEHNLLSDIKARSLRLQSSSLSKDHPLVQRGMELGWEYYGSPTLSDQALCRDFSTLKLGPGSSGRSHTADEYIRVSEIQEGIEKYIQLLTGLKLEKD
ncbi:M20/M25/M40 family metallo-hydrolase [Tunicatimonas pelagia]|uniref:M20/M25/M40 family metallo-hydrolase n=1 Tax=Tunicatimonas pelagia TaxID=931531 RepID=UPI002665BECB|nr:M20/M25/M40 family metallo-hydrolase [Tunicatimonas pelagia]WKN42801.1 M20/M25/M40 family metallo-hydrolase [Tunicatimonas pelagia]